MNDLAINVDLARLRAIDFETPKTVQGRGAPPIVCGSVARIVDVNVVETVKGELLINDEDAVKVAEEYLDAGYILVGANIAYDMACLAQRAPWLLPKIFKAYREGRIYDVLLAQALDAIFHGHLGKDPRTGQDLRREDGKSTGRYSLWNVTAILLGREDAKKNDDWRKSYALLWGFPTHLWPPAARQYPIDDSVNQLQNALAQILGVGKHEWVMVPGIPGVVPDSVRCQHCSEALTTQASTRPCSRGPRQPHRNLGNLPAQAEFAFCIHLGACHGLRTDGARIEKLAAEVEEKYKIAVERFQKFGWIREDETEDSAAVKRSVVIAYGAKGTCRRCGGGVQCPRCLGEGKKPGEDKCKECYGAGWLTGRIRPVKWKECRGAKERGRYQNCGGDACSVCRGKKQLEYLGDAITCLARDGGCDGTGVDVSTAILKRTDTGGICADRDVKMESGDDDLHDFGDDSYGKIRNTYVPYLRKGVDKPLTFKPNVLLKSGRMSYGTSDSDQSGEPIQQFSRKGGARECICARPGCVLCSVDFSAGELCSLSQYTKWIVGFSRMMEIINQTKDPGSLHTMLGAQMLGISFDEMKKRVKDDNKEAKDFRQASKCANFGFPGGLGAATLVLTNRRKNAGMTKLPDGREIAGIRFCVLMGGAKQCGMTQSGGSNKIQEWKGHAYAPMCRACVEIAEYVLKKTFFETFPEVRKYLDWVTAYTEQHNKTIPQYAWDKEQGKLTVLRIRGDVGFCDAANQGFQGLLADIFKRAFCTMSREGYLGVKDDGSQSPLVGARFPLAFHDESLSELRLETAHVAGPRIADISMESGYDLAPDVYWFAEPALMRSYSKDAKTIYAKCRCPGDHIEGSACEKGKLLVWTPDEELAA